VQQILKVEPDWLDGFKDGLVAHMSWLTEVGMMTDYWRGRQAGQDFTAWLREAGYLVEQEDLVGDSAV